MQGKVVLNDKLKEFFGLTMQSKYERIIDDVTDIYNKNCDIKDFEKTIKQVEKAIRNTPEYKQWVKKRGENIEYCQLCGIHFQESGLKKEVHHAFITLYEIVVNVIDELIQEHKNSITTSEIIERVLEKHLSGEVFSVVLCKCCHLKCHYEKKEFGSELSLSKKIEEISLSKD